MTTGAPVIGTMTDRVMMKGTTLAGTAEESGTVKVRREAGSAAETGTETATAAAGMTVLMAMTGTAGEPAHHPARHHRCRSTHRTL